MGIVNLLKIQNHFALYESNPFIFYLSHFTILYTESIEIKGGQVKTITGLDRPRGLAVSDNGDIVVAEWGAHRVTIVNKEGKKVRSFGIRGTSEGHFTNPRGIAITNDEHILVTDEHRLQKLTFDGVCVQSVGSTESGRGQLQFNYPKGIAVHPTTGLVFVADSYNNRIQVFNSDLTFACCIALHGDEQFSLPFDVSLDSDGCLYVAEYRKHCITKLTTTGEFITRFHSKGSGHDDLYYPNSLTINNNLVYVSEWNNVHVSIFNTKGTFLHCFGKKGSGDGEFSYTYGITTDTFGKLYVSDSGNNRIVVF